MKFLEHLTQENVNAAISIGTTAKMIMTGASLLFLGISIIKGAFKLVKIAVIVFLVYLAATQFGLI